MRAANFLASLGGALAALLMSGCTTQREQPGVAQALQTVQASDFLKTIETLASDDFEGRSVGTEGGAKTVDYVAGEFKRIGLMPGNPDGTYLQAVPLIGFRSTPSLSISVGGRQIDLKFPDDFVAFSYERQPEVRVSRSELVFVGYGATAPEYFWDDYKGTDLKGKTLLMLINDPQIPDPPADPTRFEDKMFRGKAMSHYGRWAYKYEIAASVGADGVLSVHETATAGYPYAVVVNSWSRENFDVRLDESNPHFPVAPAWITLERAKELFAAAGLDYAAQKRAALRPDFKPVDLHATVDLTVKNAWREVPSYNVVGRIPGSDPKLKDQYVIYSAHWDHFGWDRSLPGSKHDQVFHGAVDNASGVAALLELAKAYAALPRPPRRSILFIATTAEERGLLGAQYYASHPLYPLRDTLADINIDGMNMWGRTRDVQNVGQGSSDLDAVLAAVARSQGRRIVGDRSPERGSFYRADHFEFAKAGVPSLFVSSGDDYIGRPGSFGKDRREEYVNERYHRVTDVVRPDWDLSGAVEDIELLFRTGYKVAQRDAFPQWNAGAEFKSQRDAMMRN